MLSDTTGAGIFKRQFAFTSTSSGKSHRSGASVAQHRAGDETADGRRYFAGCFSVCRNASTSAISCGLRMSPIGGIGEMPSCS